MEKLKLNLKNCYGIKKLEHIFNFSGNKDEDPNRFIGIYSPNGAMKTSLAKTLSDVEKAEKVPPDIYGNSPSKEVLMDGKEIDQKSVLVIESFDNDLASMDIEGSSTLLLNDGLKEEYEQLIDEEKQKREEMLSDIKARSGLSVEEFCKEVEEVFRAPLEEVVGKYINSNSPAENQDVLPGIKYKDFFNSSLESVCNTEEVKTKFQEYQEKVSSLPFFNDSFSSLSLYAIKEALKKYSFFHNERNKIVMYGGEGESEEEKEFKTVEGIEQFFKEQISNAAEPIIKVLDKNERTRNIAKQLRNNPWAVAQLNDTESFKKDVLVAYLFDKQQECASFLEVVRKNKEKIAKIKKKAEGEETLWEESLKIFKERFNVPFDITIQNKSNAVLEGKQPKFFHFEISRGEKECAKKNIDDLGFLSAGEKRALYILRAIFNIEKRKKELGDGKEMLIIFDDIVDSFDYKNKYAFLQYLKDFKEDEENLYFIILTHNFDFFRNLVKVGILKGDFEHRFIATNKEGEITISKFESHIIQNPFGNLAKGKHFGGVEIVACISFLRTLLEMRGEKKGDDYNSLTSMLHVNKDSDNQKVPKIGEMYKKILNKEMKTNGLPKEKKVREYIEEVIDKEIVGKDIKESDLYEKLCLSIGLRLLTEDFCIKKLGKNPNDIKESKEIFTEFLESENVGFAEKREVVKRVSIETPGYIHNNAFMYEPLIDQSADELISLYKTLKEWVDKTSSEG